MISLDLNLLENSEKCFDSTDILLSIYDYKKEILEILELFNNQGSTNLQIRDIQKAFFGKLSDKDKLSFLNEFINNLNININIDNVNLLINSDLETLYTMNNIPDIQILKNIEILSISIKEFISEVRKNINLKLSEFEQENKREFEIFSEEILEVKDFLSNPFGELSILELQILFFDKIYEKIKGDSNTDKRRTLAKFFGYEGWGIFQNLYGKLKQLTLADNTLLKLQLKSFDYSEIINDIKLNPKSKIQLEILPKLEEKKDTDINNEIIKIYGDFGDFLLDLRDKISPKSKNIIIGIGNKIDEESKQKFIESIVDNYQEKANLEDFLEIVSLFVDFFSQYKIINLPMGRIFERNLSLENISFLNNKFTNGHTIDLDKNKIHTFIDNSINYVTSGERTIIERIKLCETKFDPDEVFEYILKNGDEKNKQDLLNLFDSCIDKILAYFKQSDVSSTKLRDSLASENKGAGTYCGHFRSLLNRIKKKSNENFREGVYSINWNSIFDNSDFQSENSNLSFISKATKSFNIDYKPFEGVEALREIINETNRINNSVNISSLISLYDEAIKSNSNFLRRSLLKIKKNIEK